MRVFISFIVLLAGLLSAGCQANTMDADAPLEATFRPTSEPDSPDSGEPQMTPSLPPPADASLQNLIEAIKADLANRQAVSVDEIIVVESMAVEWSDSSLDCPQPGMEYLQVITPGYRIVLQVNGQSYEYHTNRDAYFVYCENQLPPVLPKP